MKMTEKQFNQFTGKKPKNKYNAVATWVDGMRFDSKTEALYYLVLKKQKELGQINFILRQVPFHLPGGVKLVVDFLCGDFWKGPLYVHDVKGAKPTEAWNAKSKIVRAIYGININIVSRKMVLHIAKYHGVSLGELDGKDARRAA